MLKLLVLALLFSAPVFAQSQRVTFMRAAPGQLLDLIDTVNAAADDLVEAGLPDPLVMRHSQGDQWDLMLLEMTTGDDRDEVMGQYTDRINELAMWQEDLDSTGPTTAAIQSSCAEAGFFHVEMFRALAGHHAKLLEQRHMENVYLKFLDRPENLVFTRTRGASYTHFTVGCYRDIQHFAESGDIPADKEDEAARTAGFEAANRIGTYLRSLLLDHHDTLATRVSR